MTDWFDPTGIPATSASGSSAVVRSEFTLIQTNISNKLPTLTGNGSLPIAINSGGTAIEAKTVDSFRTLLGINGTGVATFLATPSSANLLAAVTDETGTGALVFATSPTLITPTLGVASATSYNGHTFTTGSSTFTGTAGQTYTFPTTSATLARIDAANVFTGVQTMTSPALTTPVISGVATGTGVSTTAVSTLVLRDASGNFTAGTITASLTGNASGSSGSTTGNAATVTTNANLTGHVTSTGNAAVLGSFTLAQLNTAISDADITLTAATQAQMETATSDTASATALSVNWHPGVAKCWIKCTGDGTTINVSHNITSITDTGTGILTVTIATDFSSSDYAIAATILAGSGIAWVDSQAAGSFVIEAVSLAGSAADPTSYYASCFGDQA